jgi:hypothetical protein
MVMVYKAGESKVDPSKVQILPAGGATSAPGSETDAAQKALEDLLKGSEPGAPSGGTDAPGGGTEAAPPDPATAPGGGEAAPTAPSAPEGSGSAGAGGGGAAPPPK